MERAESEQGCDRHRPRDRKTNWRGWAACILAILAASILSTSVSAAEIAGRTYVEEHSWAPPPGEYANRGGIADLDGDGDAELVITYGTAAEGGKAVVFDLDGGTLTPRQFITPPDGGQVRSFILDVDARGLPELVVTTVHYGGDSNQNGTLAI